METIINISTWDGLIFLAKMTVFLIWLGIMVGFLLQTIATSLVRGVVKGLDGVTVEKEEG